METKHRKHYLDLRTKQDKEIDEKLKKNKSLYQSAKNKQNSRSWAMKALKQLQKNVTGLLQYLTV